MSLSRFFIERPIFAWVVALIIMLFGIVSITRLPVSQYPDIAPPAVSISAGYPGADAQTRAGFRHADHRAEHDGARWPAVHVLDQ